MGRLTIVGLGPAGPELITPETRAALDGQAPVRLRTARHPAAASVDAPTFDGVYETGNAIQCGLRGNRRAPRS